MDRDVPKKDTQDRVLAKKPYQGCDLHSFTACFLHHSEAICAILPSGHWLSWGLSCSLVAGGRSPHLPECFPSNTKR